MTGIRGRLSYLSWQIMTATAQWVKFFIFKFSLKKCSNYMSPGVHKVWCCSDTAGFPSNQVGHLQAIPLSWCDKMGAGETVSQHSPLSSGSGLRDSSLFLTGHSNLECPVRNKEQSLSPEPRLKSSANGSGTRVSPILTGVKVGGSAHL